MVLISFLIRCAAVLIKLSVLLLRIFVRVKVMQNPGRCTVQYNDNWFLIYFCYDCPFPKVFQQLALHVWEAVWLTVL